MTPDIRTPRAAFEYQWVELRSRDTAGDTFTPFITKLTAYGAEGWELCCFQYGFAFFKRAMPETASSAATETESALRLLRFVRMMRMNVERDIFIDPVKRAMYVGMIDVAIAEFVIASASKTSGCESPQGPPETSTSEVPMVAD